MYRNHLRLNLFQDQLALLFLKFLLEHRSIEVYFDSLDSPLCCGEIFANLVKTLGKHDSVVLYCFVYLLHRPTDVTVRCFKVIHCLLVSLHLCLHLLYAEQVPIQLPIYVVEGVLREKFEG